MRNVKDITVHLSHSGNFHLGDEICPDEPVMGVDGKGVTTVTRGTITSIQQRGNDVFLYVQDIGMPGRWCDKTRRIQIAGRLFDSLYPEEFGVPTLA